MTGVVRGFDGGLTGVVFLAGWELQRLTGVQGGQNSLSVKNLPFFPKYFEEFLNSQKVLPFLGQNPRNSQPMRVSTPVIWDKTSE